MGRKPLALPPRFLQQKLPDATPPPVLATPPEAASLPKKPKTVYPCVGIFIDGDNQPSSQLEMVQKAASFWGTILICRVYGVTLSPKWQQACQQFGAELRLLPPGGNTDILLAMEAEAEAASLQIFFLVSEDGDFSTIATHLLRHGKVVGLGSSSASHHFQQACTHFVHLPTKTDGPSLTRLFHQEKFDKGTTPDKKS